MMRYDACPTSSGPKDANFFFGDLENFPTSGVKGRVLLEATPPVGHLLMQLRSSTLESHKATTRTALLKQVNLESFMALKSQHILSGCGYIVVVELTQTTP